MLLLGWSPGQKQEKLTLEEAVEKFDMRHVSKSSARFDPKKLDWLAEKYFRQADPERLVELIITFLPQEAKEIERTRLKALVEAVRPGLANLSQVAREAGWFFKEPVLDEGQL